MEAFFFDKIKSEYGATFDFVPLSLYNFSSQPLIRRFTLEHNLLEQDSVEKWRTKAEEEIENRDEVGGLPDVPPEQQNLLDKKAEYAYSKYTQAVSNKNISIVKKKGGDVSTAKQQADAADERVDRVRAELDSATDAAKARTERTRKVPFSVRGVNALSIGFSSLYRLARGGLVALRPALAGFLASPAGQLIGGAMLVALISFASYRAFQFVFKKAEIACRGLSGEEKSECIKNYKISAMERRITDLRAGLPYCTSAKDPAVCSAKLRAKINKQMLNLRKLRTGESEEIA
jgi:hypothetical protein